MIQHDSIGFNPESREVERTTQTIVHITPKIVEAAYAARAITRTYWEKEKSTVMLETSLKCKV